MSVRSESENEDDDCTYIRFKNALIKESVNKTYPEYLNEWYICGSIVLKDTFDNCICGKDIKHIYILMNIITQNKIKVGCVCVRNINKRSECKILSRCCYCGEKLEKKMRGYLKGKELCVLCKTNQVIHGASHKGKTLCYMYKKEKRWIGWMYSKGAFEMLFWRYFYDYLSRVSKNDWDKYMCEPEISSNEDTDEDEDNNNHRPVDNFIRNVLGQIKN